MTQKAIAYVSDIVLGKTGEVISRKEQRAAIRRYAEEHDFEIVAWFEDEAYSIHLRDRPGVRQLLASELEFDYLLVERVGCLSGRWPELRRFQDRLLGRGARMESATLRWDCVSQMARYYPRRLGERARQERLAARAATDRERDRGQGERSVSIARPMALNFIPLIASEHTM
jgi:DNA invertase Pin-like site-specific DNA recombinase